MSRPFVIAVASEKGGVGKTTIATNLAVYLKALREDLPVTIASFDNHFSVDQMFALGEKPGQGVADFINGVPLAELTTLGQYGVQYLASSRRLPLPSHNTSWLQQRLHSAPHDGVIILDTRPILDWFTEAALLAADLVLVPVKDRAALVNVGSLRQILSGAGRADRLWLLPSLVDSRARLNAEVRLYEFLVYAAQERDYQVLDICISKSPKVEGLASGFSSVIRPVLTHARNTAVHGQLKQLAEFVLDRFDNESRSSCGLQSEAEVEAPVTRQRLVLECPVCGRPALAGTGHLFFDLRSRRRGSVHPACFAQVFGADDFEDAKGLEHSLALTIAGPGLVGPECRLTVYRCDAAGIVLSSEDVALDEAQSLADSLKAITGRSLDVAYREFVFVDQVARAVDDQLAGDIYRSFACKRRQVLRELRDAGLF